MRGPSIVDKLCEECSVPMIGIMRWSDRDGFTAPRKNCVDCKGMSAGVLLEGKS